MKKHHQLLATAIALCVSFAANATSTALAEQYLRATQVPEMLQAQIQAYTDEYAKNQEPAHRQRLHEYLERVMGWDALKDEYMGLVRSTYTDQEIKAFMQFANTPSGRSMRSKNTTFANKLAALSAKREQAVTAQYRASSAQNTPDEQEVQASDLAISKVEKFQSGDQLYFTGEIKNNGSKLARGVSIEANLFLGEKFVDQYSAYVTGAIPAGASRFFKIACGCKGAPPAAHDTFKLQAIAGY